MMLLYNIVFLLGGVLSLPLIIAKVLTSDKRRKTVLNRLGSKAFDGVEREKPVWIHALSVGEVLAAVHLAKKIGPNRSVLLSVSTLTGHETAKRLLNGSVASIVFFPYDLIWSVRKAIRAVDPSVCVLVESDIWPNFIHEAQRREIPVILANGRISPRSFRGYRRLSFFMKPVFSSISAICAQTETDAKRFIAIGARKDRVKVTGNLKFDCKLMHLSGREISRLRASMGIGPRVSVLLAGSTHEGEEKILLKCFMVLKKSFSDLILVVVPRDPTRAYRIQQMFERAGCPASLKSELDETDGHDAPHAIVVDTMGELRQLYAIADIVFVGKSLVNLGGQNPLEPAAFKKPIIFGPHMFNFELVAEMLIQQGGAVEVANEKELMEQVKSLLLDSTRCETMGMKAYEVLGMNRGAVEKTLNVVERFL